MKTLLQYKKQLMIFFGVTVFTVLFLFLQYRSVMSHKQVTKFTHAVDINLNNDARKVDESERKERITEVQQLEQEIKNYLQTELAGLNAEIDPLKNASYTPGFRVYVDDEALEKIKTLDFSEYDFDQDSEYDVFLTARKLINEES